MGPHTGHLPSQKLEQLEQMLIQLEELGELDAQAIEKDEKRELGEILKGTKRQLEKLRNDEFHIAVVGLEKAGKSTFLSAWLNAEVLPHQDTRCTYTSTEIRSRVSHEEQRIEVEFLTREAFEKMEHDYKQAAQGHDSFEAKNARRDLEEIEAHRGTIIEHIGLSTKRVAFEDVSEIKAHLEPYVANPAIARAVRTVKVFTSGLVEQHGVIFHDVPGYDSPITMHKNQARRRARARRCGHLRDQLGGGRQPTRQSTQHIARHCRSGRPVHKGQRQGLFLPEQGGQNRL